MLFLIKLKHTKVDKDDDKEQSGLEIIMGNDFNALQQNFIFYLSCELPKHDL